MTSQPQSEFVLLYELDGVPHERALVEDRVIIGRAKDCDLCFAFNNEISRLHAMLSLTPEGWLVDDMASRSGTFVNGERVGDARLLRDKDVLTIGQVGLTLREKKHGTETITVDRKSLDLASAGSRPAERFSATADRSLATDETSVPAPPANFYDLIGVPLFEPDLEKIQDAAKRRLSELRAATDPATHAKRRAEIDTIAAGLAAVSHPERRRVYDSELAERLGIDVELQGGRVVEIGGQGAGLLAAGIALVGLAIILLWFLLPWLRALLAPVNDAP
jgi:pSer/pThr/pTyr-binding forkhead associated (FHA) protein